MTYSDWVPAFFRAAGTNFDLDAYINRVSLVPQSIWRRGESRGVKNPHVMHWSGFFLAVSEAGGDDLRQQILDAITFIKRNDSDLAILAACPGLEALDLDFSINTRDVAVQVDQFPSELLLLMGRLEIDLVISRCPSPLESADNV